MFSALPVHAQLDTNGNTMSDIWERAFNNGQLFPPGFLPGGDADGDGRTNFDESVAGTDPLSPTPPDGFLIKDLYHVSATWLSDPGGGEPELITPESYVIEWFGILGKSYQLHCSPDLAPGSWLPVGDPITGYGYPITIGTMPQHPDGSAAARLFWKLEVGDIDSDGDGLTDHEEYVLGSDPWNGFSYLSLPDLWFATHFPVEFAAGGEGFDPNGDADGDGDSNFEEIIGGTDPNAADPAGSGRWVAVQGDGSPTNRISRTRQFTVPAGQSAILIVAIASAEFSYYTDPDTSNEYNDVLDWDVVPSVGGAISDGINVNARHTAWESAEALGQNLPGMSGPVHFEEIHTLTAPADAPLTIDVEIGATNVEDAQLPSQVAVGVLPVEVIIPKLDVNGDQIDGKFVGATELKVAKWENAFEGTFNNGSVKDDFIGWDKDRFYIQIPGGSTLGVESVEVVTEDCSDPAYNDDPTLVPLTTNGDDAISDSLILVSDDDDDNYAGSGAGADDQEGDRTHKVQLGGNFVIKSITIAGQKHDVEMKIPVPFRKILSVDFIRLNVAGVHTLQEIDEAVRVINERYAQVGVRVDVSIDEIPWPTSLAQDPGRFEIFNLQSGDLVGPLSDDYKLFIDSTDSVGTNLFFLLNCYTAMQARGIAVTPRQLTRENGPLEGKYIDKAFINSDQTNGVLGYTPAHEILHLLAYRPDNADDHDEPWWNLMNVVNFNQSPTVLWSKRIDAAQEGLIYEHPSVTEPE